MSTAGTTCTDPASHPWMALSATLAVQVLASMALSAAGVLGPAVAPGLGLRPDQVGLYAGIGYFVAMLAGVAAGQWVGRLGALRLSQWLLVLVALGLFISSSGWPGLIVVGAALVGLSNGMSNPAAAELLGRHSPVLATGSFFALKQTAVPVGVGLSGLFLPWGLAQWGWQAAVWALAGACLVLTMLLAPIVRQLDEGRRRDVVPLTPRQSLAAAMQEPALRRLSLVSLVYGMNQQAFLAFIVSMLTLERGLSLPVAAGMLAASQVACCGVRIGLGPVADRWVKPRALLGAIGALSSVATLIIAWAPASTDISTMTLMVVACGSFAMGWNGVYFAELVHSVPRERISASAGGTQFFTFLGSMFGPVAFGMLLRAGWSFSMAYAAFAMLTAAAAVAMIIRRPGSKAAA